MSVIPCINCGDMIDEDFHEGYWDFDKFYCESCAEELGYYGLEEAPYKCICGHCGKMAEVIENNWKCPACGWAQWKILGDKK